MEDCCGVRSCSDDHIHPVQDGTAMLWDLAEGKRLYNLDAGEIIYALCFSPNRYWLCAATTNVIKVRRYCLPEMQQESQEKSVSDWLGSSLEASRMRWGEGCLVYALCCCRMPEIYAQSAPDLPCCGYSCCPCVFLDKGWKGCGPTSPRTQTRNFVNARRSGTWRARASWTS